MKKVTVGSDSQEGLEHGLKKAQDLVANPEKLADPANEDSIDDINPSKEATTLKEAHDETPEHQAEDEVQDTKDETNLRISMNMASNTPLQVRLTSIWVATKTRSMNMLQDGCSRTRRSYCHASEAQVEKA